MATLPQIPARETDSATGESCGQRSLAGYGPRGHKELDTTEHTHAHTLHHCPQFTGDKLRHKQMT